MESSFSHCFTNYSLYLKPSKTPIAQHIHPSPGWTTSALSTCQDTAQLEKREQHPPALNPVGSLKERAGMPVGMAQSSAADFHEQKIMDLRMGHVLGGGSGPSVAAQ